MPEDVDPDDNFVTDDAYAAGRKALADGLSILENPMASTGDWGKAWFAGWLDALADRVMGTDRSKAGFARLLRRDTAEPF
jgi:ribosome modulation factor